MNLRTKLEHSIPYVRGDAEPFLDELETLVLMAFSKGFHYGRSTKQHETTGMKNFINDVSKNVKDYEL